MLGQMKTPTKNIVEMINKYFDYTFVTYKNKEQIREIIRLIFKKLIIT